MKKIKRMDAIPGRVNSSVVSWKAPEFIRYNKNITWYVVLVSVAIALTVLFYYLDNLLAMIVVILALIVMLITANQKPKKRMYKLTKDGLKIDEKFYPMSDFRSYFVTYIEDIPNLHFEMTKKITPPISIFINGIDEKQVVDFLKIYLPENTKVNATATDLLSRWFRF